MGAPERSAGVRLMVQDRLSARSARMHCRRREVTPTVRAGCRFTAACDLPGRWSGRRSRLLRRVTASKHIKNAGGRRLRPPIDGVPVGTRWGGCVLPMARGGSCGVLRRRYGLLCRPHPVAEAVPGPIAGVRGPTGNVCFGPHTAFRLFRVAILSICDGRLARPDLDRFLVPFHGLWHPVVLLLGDALLLAGFASVGAVHFFMGGDWRSGTRDAEPTRLMTTGRSRCRATQ